MNRYILLLFFGFVMAYTHAQEIKVKGFQKPVEVIRDQWGLSHIYAQNEHDLFMAQGYVAASDRLFQLEIWRRQATGTVSELLGKNHLQRDIGSRLFKFRGNIQQELNHYHPRGEGIVNAFVEGINAYIAETRTNPELLPFEFKTLKTQPEFWTPEVVISRHQGLLGNVKDELDNARAVALIGDDKLRQLQWFNAINNANEPNLSIDPKINSEQLFQPILRLYEAFRSPLKFTKEEVFGEKIGANFDTWYDDEKQNVGSNNWVIAGNKSQSGYPMLANDPHRAQSVPSLRYWVHLNAPGWNVIGGGEPTLPGVSIGHNDKIGWGLTIFETDNEDLYVYETNPKNPNQYLYKGQWENLKAIKDTIIIKGGEPQIVTLKYTRHGPVVFEDEAHQRLYAVRAGWLEQGCSPYLASLRMNQASNWEEFRKACTFSRIPGENMVYADQKGNIGWQAVGISPIRTNWTGLVPVMGDGRYEWAGYLPIEKLPHSTNPKEGFIATANNNLTPRDFPNRNAIGWTWANPARAHRIEEVLNQGNRLNLNDFGNLQTDYFSATAQTLVNVFGKINLNNNNNNNNNLSEIQSKLTHWDYKLSPQSVEAAIYVEWEKQLRKGYYELMVDKKVQKYIRTLPTKRLVDWVVSPIPMVLNQNPIKSRDSLMVVKLENALDTLKARLGNDTSNWQYGQAKNKHIKLTHALSALVSPDMQAKINLGPLPRGGYAETVGNTGSNLNQEHGASFKILMDTEDWDKTLGTNNPGQSANPNDKHYGDLFALWASGQYFPVYFTKEKIKDVADRVWVLK